MIVHNDIWNGKGRYPKFACGTKISPGHDQSWQSGPGLPDLVTCKKCISKHNCKRKPTTQARDKGTNEAHLSLTTGSEGELAC